MLSLETLESYLDGDLDPQFGTEIQAHITDCERCQETLNLLARTKVSMESDENL
ncbi:MAG TPA: zf-HC2 domain-containing protein [Candidatus Paceibacterota bacterium]